MAPLFSPNGQAPVQCYVDERSDGVVPVPTAPVEEETWSSPGAGVAR